MLAKKQKPIFSCYINGKIKSEWMMREEGSFEDHKQAEDHVYKILARSRKGKIDAYTMQELVKLSKSSDHCCTWQNGDPDSDKADAAIAKLSKKIDTALKSFIKL